MRTLNEFHESAESADPQIDWSKPVIEFDPWPFLVRELRVPDSRFLSASGWTSTTDGFVLCAVDPVLGWATDGRPFVTNTAILNARYGLDIRSA